jgi:hypothetical protein
MGRLNGKVAAVMGGASGIGEATVRRFIAEGASAAFCDRDGDRGRRVAAELEATGAKVAFTQADVGTEAACLAFVNGAAQQFGRLPGETVEQYNAQAARGTMLKRPGRAEEVAAAILFWPPTMPPTSPAPCCSWTVV